MRKIAVAPSSSARKEVLCGHMAEGSLDRTEMATLFVPSSNMTTAQPARWEVGSRTSLLPSL